MKQYNRTEKEKQSAIARLKLNKEKCRECNFFGESNIKHIDIMIDVIQNARSEDWIYTNYPSHDRFGNEDSSAHSDWVAAINARDYLFGDIDMRDLLYPEY